MGENYQYNQLSYEGSLKYVKVPKFQRSLVWSKQKKLDLLNTLHKKFPFGALLVAPVDGSKQEYRLLDGQQRLSTIRDFEKHRVSYWKDLNNTEYNSILTKLNTILSNHGGQLISANEFDQLLDPDFELADWTDKPENAPLDQPTKKNVRDIIKQLRIKIADYVDLDHLMIPVIEFLGDESDLPEVYENLNRGGVPLTKYEVLNASWSDEKIKIPEHFELGDSILKYVKGYYNQLRNNGAFELENFSEDDITNSREINLAEFARALGNLVIDQIPSLITSSTKLINEFGFGLLGIVTGIDNKKVATVHNQSGLIQEQIKPILEQADQLAKLINNRFEKILKQNIAFGNHPKSKKSQYVNGLTTTFKILSYFASLWNRDSKDVSRSLDNIPSYYVYDFITNAWNAHGDQRLYDYYQKNNNRNYLSSINEAEFQSSFHSWLSDNLGIRKTFSKEVKALITIHSNLTYLAKSLPASEDYEFEHVIPKARILESDSGPNVVYVSHLGNGMFLPKSLNNSKSSQTLYEFDRDAESVDYQKLRKDSDYFSQVEFQQIFNDLDTHQFDDVNDFIKQRSFKMANQIIRNLNPNNEIFHKINSRNDNNNLTRK
ncbi:GmrSD restriction endonuclease domain-containing protein [Lactobacillaceae bacterium Scapto_B20]